jgi:hypothetical protein
VTPAQSRCLIQTGPLPGEQRSLEGHDPCIARLPGVKFACCGHGVRPGYVAFHGGRVLRGWFDHIATVRFIEMEKGAIRDLDEMLRVFREQVEPVYGRSSRLVRDRIKKDVAQGFERIDRSTPAVTERNDD